MNFATVLESFRGTITKVLPLRAICSFCEGTGIHENYRDFINTVERAAKIDANSAEERMSEASHYDWLDDQSLKMKEALIGIEKLCDNQNPTHENIWRIAHATIQEL